MTPKPKFTDNTIDEDTLTFNSFEINGNNTGKKLACEELRNQLHNWKYKLTPEDMREVVKFAFQGGDLRYTKQM